MFLFFVQFLSFERLNETYSRSKNPSTLHFISDSFKGRASVRNCEADF